MHLRRSLCALLCLAILPAWAQYDKRELKPWFSLDAAVRHQQVDGINATIFEDVGTSKPDGSSAWDTTVAPYYKTFDAFPTAPPNLNFGLGAGVEYDRFLMGFHTGFSLPRVSQKPADPNSPDGELSAVLIADSAGGAPDTAWVKFHDAAYYMVNIDISFGWMWLPPASKLNFITTLRAGFTLLNVKYPGEYKLYINDTEGLDPLTVRNTYYTSSGRSIAPELELRYSLSPAWKLSAFGGYRYCVYDQIPLASTGKRTSDWEAYWFKGSSDVDVSSAYIGARLTLVLRSDKEKAQDFNE